MDISLFGYTLSVAFGPTDWKKRVIDTVNREMKHKGTMRYSKIEHIKAVRRLGRLFPEEYYVSSGLLGLSEAKQFVEENWSF